MHRLLKPGGELIFWEHCRNTDAVTGAVQCKFHFPSQSCFLSSDDFAQGCGVSCGQASSEGAGWIASPEMRSSRLPTGRWLTSTPTVSHI